MIPDRDGEFSNIMRAGFIHTAATEVTIATGVIKLTKGYHHVDTEADAASDDLDTINGMPDGMLAFIRPTSDARTVVIKHGTGNIFCPGGTDISLAEATDVAMLYSDGTHVIVVAGSDLTGLTLTFSEIKAALAIASSAVGFNKQALTGVHSVALNNAGDTFANTLIGGATANRANTVADAAGVLPVAATVGTTTTVLHGNAAAGSAGAYGAVVLTADVSGVLPVANGGTGLSAAPESALLSTTVTIANAALKTMNATPVIAVAAPGAGLYHEVVSVNARMIFAVAAFDSVGAAEYLELRYTDASGVLITQNVNPTGFADQATTQQRLLPLATGAAAFLNPVAAAAVVAHIAGGEWYAAAGGGSLKLEILYRTRTLAI